MGEPVILADITLSPPRVVRAGRPLPEPRRLPTWQAVREEAAKPPRVLNQHAIRSEYAGGRIQKHNAMWNASWADANRALRYSLATMRARSRALERDDPYVRRFLSLVETNVIGANGIIMKSQAKDLVADGTYTMDVAANRILEREYEAFSQRGNYEVTGQYSRAAYERLFVRTLARDGEVLEKIVADPTSRWGFRFQIIEADWLDETYNEDRMDGTRIIMGVELAPSGRPVAYWLRDRHPGDYPSGGYRRIRYTTEEVRHYFVPMRPGEVRGVPWIHAAMTRLYQLGEYNEAAIIAARIGAEKTMLLKEQEVGSAAALADNEDDRDAGNKGMLSWKSSKGAIDIIPFGTDIANWTPNYPDQNFGPFVLASIRGIASGVNVSYESLSNDRNGVTWTSIRHAVLDERDGWMILQNWMIDAKSRSTYTTFLTYGFLAKQKPFAYLPAGKLAKFDAPQFHGRRWDWVNPKDDIEATMHEIRGRLTSHRRVLAKRGIDLEQLLSEIWEDNQLAKKYDIDLDAAVANVTVRETVPVPPNETQGIVP